MQGEKGHALVGNSFWGNSECTVLISGPVFVYSFVVRATYLRAWPRWGCEYHISWWWCQWNAEWTDAVPEVSCSSGTQAWGERNCVSNPAARWLRSSPSNAQTPCRRGDNMQPWGTKWQIHKIIIKNPKKTVWFEFKDTIRPKYRYIQAFMFLFKPANKAKFYCYFLQTQQTINLLFFFLFLFFKMIFKDKIQMCPY